MANYSETNVTLTNNMQHLTQKYQPQNLNDIIGQDNPKRIVKNMLNNNAVQSLILYGPTGTGKSSLAYIIANLANKQLFKLNATNTSTKDIQEIAKKAKQEPVILYLDEIQAFNKKQQQSLLPYIEDGSITLIAATTENPYHSIYKALLSRCIILEFTNPTTDEILPLLDKILINERLNQYFDNTIKKTIINISNNDIRRTLNLLQLIINQYPNQNITLDMIKSLIPSVNMNDFDTNKNTHHDLLSALQKSIRGSNPDASVFYLCKLLEGNDIISPIRRLQVIACEDIGLADPNAITITKACCDSARELGLPEAYKPLVHATLYLALAPKSSSNEDTYFPAIDLIKNGYGKEIPKQIRQLPRNISGYKYPHDYPDHYVEQEYIPEDIKHIQLYKPNFNSFEQNAHNYWQQIKNKKGD